MAKKGAIDFQSFLLKLKAEKLTDAIGALTAEEKLILKDAFGKGKALVNSDPALTDDLEKALAEGDFGKVRELIAEDNPSIKYSPTAKHKPGGWGTNMDLSDEVASRVLNESDQLGKQRYAYFNGRIYEFQSDNVGGWHGYPIPSSDLKIKAGGSDLLRRWRDNGKFSNAEYKKLIKNK